MDMAMGTFVSECVGNEWTPDSWQVTEKLGGDQHASNDEGDG
jgi:hypothetical protein